MSSLRRLATREIQVARRPATRAAVAPAAAPAKPGFRADLPFAPQSLLGLQRSAGNAAVARMLRRDGRISIAEAAANLKKERYSRPRQPAVGPVRFRLPTTADMKAMVTKGDIPEAKLKDAVALAL